ncbi:MAG TPA: DUF5666 domain-containing protein [Candidatus Saccharimonadales bacterium]|nr:DUF5666 domain-containing protein [Candidatus Saccharimonadales bacterium]
MNNERGGEQNLKNINANTILIAVLVALVVGGAAFFGGMKYQQSKRMAGGQFGARQGANGQRQGPGGNGNNRPIAGQITAIADNSITVKLMDGTSKIVILSDSTSINKAATATKGDLTNGENVAVFGMTNTDGSVTAQNIQLNPMMRFGQGGQGQNTTQGQ